MPCFARSHTAVSSAQRFSAHRREPHAEKYSPGDDGAAVRVRWSAELDDDCCAKPFATTILTDDERAAAGGLRDESNEHPCAPRQVTRADVPGEDSRTRRFDGMARTRTAEERACAESATVCPRAVAQRLRAHRRGPARDAW